MNMGSMMCCTVFIPRAEPSLNIEINDAQERSAFVEICVFRAAIAALHEAGKLCQINPYGHKASYPSLKSDGGGIQEQ